MSKIIAPALPAKIIYAEKRSTSLKLSGTEKVNFGKYNLKAYNIMIRVLKK